MANGTTGSTRSRIDSAQVIVSSLLRSRGGLIVGEDVRASIIEHCSGLPEPTNPSEDATLNWVRALLNIPDEVVAIDGKTLRRSHDRFIGKSAIHMVNAWAVGHRLVLGQVKTEAKSNEITTIPRGLKMLDLKGAVVISSDNFAAF